MKLHVALVAAAMFLPIPSVMAQGLGSSGCGQNCIILGGCNAVFSGCGSTEPYCDNKNNTAAEASECKLKFWREEVDRIEKQNADVMKALAHAKERVEAFSKSR